MVLFRTYNHPFKKITDVTVRYKETWKVTLPRRAKLASVGESHDLQGESKGEGHTCEALSSCFRTTLIATI
jgi:hypothetical protein